MTHRPSLFILISYYAIVFSFALIFANGWFTACGGFYGASASWLSHMKNKTITIYLNQLIFSDQSKNVQCTRPGVHNVCGF